MAEEIILVNEEDQIIGHEKDQKVKSTDIYRVAKLSIQNSKGEVLIAQMHRTKRNSPLKWGPATTGTVRKDESYEDAIFRKAEEELGIAKFKLKESKKILVPGMGKHFVQWFSTTIDKDSADFKIQEDEVEEVKWVSKEELLKLFDESPATFIPSIHQYFEILKIR